MRLDICIPAYNEASIIPDTIRTVLRSVEGLAGVSSRVVVVDNSSTDGTADAARSVAHPSVSVLSISLRGKGAAITEAARISTADFFAFIDADLSAHPDDIETLLAPIIASQADIVIGSRLLDQRIVSRNILRTISSKMFNAVRRAILGIRVLDSQCGLKIMDEKGRRLLARCQETGWFFDLEFLARAERAGLSIREVPVRWEEERYVGRSSKLRPIKDGILALIAMGRIALRLRRDAHATV